ncbi:MAG: hypothetical protein LBB41_05785 [Prevotellaceae bacterium]|jgi:hypothetical protein|nr:hypothetical protein [Prevotellaceae bacterium]
MKIEKVKNFNQVMLAIASVLLSIVLIVSLIAIIVNSGIFNRFHPDYPDNNNSLSLANTLLNTKKKIL